jgi:hypothetical protein
MSFVRENVKKEIFGFSTEFTSNCGMWVCGSFFNGQGREIRGGKYGFKASTIFWHVSVWIMLRGCGRLGM